MPRPDSSSAPATKPPPVPSAAVAADSASFPANPWPFLISLALVAGLAELAYAIVSVSALPVFLKDALGLPDLVGTSLTFFYLSEALFNSPMGSLADRIGRRRLMVLGALASVLTSLGTAFLRMPHHASPYAKFPIIVTIIVMRLLDGVGAAAFWPAIFASVGDRVAPERQVSAMSVLNISYMIGIAFGPKVGGYLDDALSERLSAHAALRYAPSFLTAALCFALAGGVAYLIAPRRSEEHHHAPGETSPAAAASEHAGTFSLNAVKDSLRRVPVLMLLAFLTFFGIGLIAPNVKLFAMDRFHTTENEFGNLLLLPALFVAAVAIPIGRLGDRLGKVRSIHIGMAVCAAALWLILAVHREHVVVIIGCLLGLGFVIAFPAYMALLSDLTGPKERGGVIGSVRMAQGMGAMIGAPLGSLLYEHLAKESPFLLAAALLTLSFILGLFFIKVPDRKPSGGDVPSPKSEEEETYS